MIWNDSLYGNYRNRKFADVWSAAQYTKEQKEELFGDEEIDDVGIFLQNYHNNGIPTSITDDNATTLYYLLYARYGNSTVASSDENQFKYKVFSTIYMYGPAWEKRLELQKTAVKLKVEDVMADGGSAIYNHAYNPSNMPTTQTTNELNYINDQNVTKYKKSKVDAIAVVNSLIETDVTEEFIAKFKKLFLTIVEPELPLWYITDEGDELQ